MKTTIGKIKSFGPCADGWKTLTKNHGADFDKEVTLLQILDSNGIRDAMWALRCWDYKEYALLLASIAESVVEIFKKLNKNMHNDDPSFYRLPDSRELAAQYLLLYEMSLPFGRDLTNHINIDKSCDSS